MPAAEMEEEVKVLCKADPNKRESLQSEADLDPMDGEQTWPTEEELREAEGESEMALEGAVPVLLQWC